MMSGFLGILQKLGLTQPFSWEIGLEDVEGVGVSFETKSSGHFWRYPTLITDKVVARGFFTGEADIPKAIEEFTKKLFGECGWGVPTDLE